ncbi:MAG: 4-hydroxybenzoate octaprenyltransferase [Candidatus Eisenbacteria bacterium]
MASATSNITAPSRLRTYASFVRFEHTLFSLPLILAGVFTVRGPSLSLARWLLVAVAAVGARTAGMSLNRLIDRHIDARNPRTVVRELPAGRMKLAEGFALLLVSTAAYLAACTALGPWYLKLSMVPLVVFTVYPYLKRFTPFCHFGVGAALALAPLAGYAAGHPDMADPWPALWLAAFALFWVSGFDIIYATLDEEFDRSNGIHSMVAWLGRPPALRISWGLHLIAIAALAKAYWILSFRPGPAAWSAWVLPLPFFVTVVVLLYLEQKWAEDVNLAFFRTNVWVGFAVLLMVLSARLGNGGF